MADQKLAYATTVTLTITNANLTSSATAGWQSAAQDNTSNKYLDALLMVDLAAVNTAPASNKAIYLFGYGLGDGAGSAYTTTGDGVISGSEGTITFPNVGSQQINLPLVGIIPYYVQNKQLIGGPFSIARAFGGILPAKYGVGMINFSGMTLSVNSIKITPIYATIA